jgi:PIN domain nuclease of toxin-antitoxin system
VKLLLDTHAFIWWVMDDPRLTQHARDMMVQPDNDLFLSAASAWEISIKWRLGKLELPDAPLRFIPLQMSRNRIESLAITQVHGLRIGELPEIHNDPFDRMLVAQSQLEAMPIVTRDPNIARYDVEIIW